jgi:hypothetical protein
MPQPTNLLPRANPIIILQFDAPKILKKTVSFTFFYKIMNINLSIMLNMLFVCALQ